MQLKRLPTHFTGETVKPEDVEKEFDNLVKQQNQMLGDTASTKLEFYVSETDGGSADKKLNIEINKYGIVTKLSIT